MLGKLEISLFFTFRANKPLLLNSSPYHHHFPIFANTVYSCGQGPWARSPPSLALSWCSINICWLNEWKVHTKWGPTQVICTVIQPIYLLHKGPQRSNFCLYFTSLWLFSLSSLEHKLHQGRDFHLIANYHLRSSPRELLMALSWLQWFLQSWRPVSWLYFCPSRAELSGS